MSYGIRVNKDGEQLFLQRNNLIGSYVGIEEASSTTDLLVLADWVEYVENDKDNGTIQNFKTVEFSRSANVVNLDTGEAVKRKALSKLTRKERKALGY